MFNVQGAFVDPVVEGGLAGLLAEENWPQANPAVLEEQAQERIGALRVDIASFVGDSRGALRAEAALARSHAQTHLTTYVVELSAGQGVHGLFQHLG